MATQSSVTLNAHVYAPAGVSNGVARWLDKSSSAAHPQSLTESVGNPSAQGMFRIRFKLDVPVVAASDTACACAGSLSSTARVDISVLVPASFTAAQRTDLQLQITALAASAAFVSAVKDLEAAW